MTRKENTEWIPIQVEEVDIVAYELRVRKWVDDPSSDPELERWHQYGVPKGLPFQMVKPTQDEIDFKKYYPMFLDAVELEKKGETTKALEKYKDILDSFTPFGTTYYENPIYLLEIKGDYLKAIRICKRAIQEIEKKSFNADANDFIIIKKRLESKLGRYGSEVFNARMQVLFNKIQSNPDINQKILHSSLINDDDWSYGEVASVIDYALKNELIQRIKRGRAYSFFVN